MAVDIRQQIDVKIAEKIFGNKDNALIYLKELNKISPVKGLYNTARQRVIPTSADQVWNLVASSWNYNVSKDIIRAMFRSCKKYTRGLAAHQNETRLKQEWTRLNLGDFKWPFSQNQFDAFVQGINSQGISATAKDEAVQKAAVQFRRVKEINTCRNDYLETLIYSKSDAIIPTLSHSRGVDFFIDGISYDQKVSRSVTNEFKSKYGNDWRDRAIANPAEVAEFLYTCQDEGRFGADPRLLIVYVDEDVPASRISETIDETDFFNPTHITFTYKGGTKYSTFCIIILLYNQ